MHADICKQSNLHEAGYQCADSYVRGLDRDLLHLAFNVSVGAHHDSITGTFKPLVHLDEKGKFNNAINMLNAALDREFAEY